MAFEIVIVAYSLSSTIYLLLLSSLIIFILGYIEYLCFFVLITRGNRGPFSYDSGFVFTDIALGNLGVVLSLKAKKWGKEERSMIW